MMRETISHAGQQWHASLDGEIDIWMGVENGKKLGLAAKFEIDIYIYIYIYIYINFLTYLYSDTIIYIIPYCSE